MNFDTYLQTVLLRARPLPKPQQIDHAILGFGTEVGELGDFVKRVMIYGVTPVNKPQAECDKTKEISSTNMLEECGDCLWYFVLGLHEHGMPMAVLNNLLIGVLHYPSEAYKGHSDFLLWTRLMTLAGRFIDLKRVTPTEAQVLAHDVLAVLVTFLDRYGFTVEQCLVANDAKLERRYGKSFNPAATLGRDTNAEAAILEQHATQQKQPDQAAG